MAFGRGCVGTPEPWQESQALVKLCPQHKRTTTLPERTRRLYRRVEHSRYADSERRAWTLGAILCDEASPTGQKTTFAWLTNLAVNQDSVFAVADQAGWLRTEIENEGFNVQPNRSLNLGHIFSQTWEHAKACHHRPQIGHLLLQLMHRNSLHPRKAGCGNTARPV